MKVVAIGEIVVDWLSLRPGKTIFDATDFHRALGGNSTNVAIGLRRLGTDVAIIGKVGADFHAEYLKQALQAEGIDLDGVIGDERYETAQCYMTTTESGEHHFRNWPNPHAADMLSADELPVPLLKGASFVHSTGISMILEPRRTAIQKAFEIVSEAGGCLSFDAGFPTMAHGEARDKVEGLLSKVHLLKVNESELRYWSDADGKSEVETLARQMFERYSPVALLVTCAARGSFIVTANGLLYCPPMPVTAVSEVGAGDAYIAGIIHWLCRELGSVQGSVPDALSALNQEQWRQAGIAGNIAGALTTLHENAYAGMPTQDRLLAEVGRFTTRSDVRRQL